MNVFLKTFQPNRILILQPWYWLAGAGNNLMAPPVSGSTRIYLLLVAWLKRVQNIVTVSLQRVNP